MVTNADKSLLGVVNLGSKDDAKLAISCLHHKKIGYKRLNVNIAFSSNNNSPKLVFRFFIVFKAKLIFFSIYFYFEKIENFKNEIDDY